MIRQTTSEIKKAERFLNEDLWLMDLKGLPWYRRFLIYLTKVLWIAGKGFIQDECALQASALTSSTLLSLVPILALTLTVAQFMGMDARLMDFLRESMAQLPEHIQVYVNHILEIIQRTRLVTIGIIGFFFLVWIYVRTMNHVETVMNKIWGIRHDRIWLQKIGTYFVMMVIVSITLVTSTSIIALAKAQAYFEIINEILGSTAYKLSIEFCSLVGIFLALAILYKVMPNTRVHLGAALFSAVVTGLCWYGWQKLCIMFQIGISNYNAIYGALATFPILVYWMYINWVILLLGAELSFALQHLKTYGLEIAAQHVSQALKRRLAFRIVYEIAKAYRDPQRENWSSSKFLEETKVPIRLLNEVLEILAQANLVAALDDGEHWVPGRDLATISLFDIEDALRGPVVGPFQHVGKVPQVIGNILKEHELRYFADLREWTMTRLLEEEAKASASKEGAAAEDSYMTF
ncbi:MAG: YihY/virulence factor BrkB family protein [Lentisphaerae bacterium]|nr:MAG: YihY/virulence factor BrkB family protein [Lentisphaerota bacterium]